MPVNKEVYRKFVDQYGLVRGRKIYYAWENRSKDGRTRPMKRLALRKHMV